MGRPCLITARWRLKFRFLARTLRGKSTLFLLGRSGHHGARRTCYSLWGMKVLAHYLVFSDSTLVKVLLYFIYLIWYSLTFLDPWVCVCQKVFGKFSAIRFPNISSILFSLFSCISNYALSDHLILFHSPLMLFSVLIYSFFLFVLICITMFFIFSILIYFWRLPSLCWNYSPGFECCSP